MRFFNKCLYLFIMICTMSCLSHTGQSDVGNKIVVEDLFISNILKAREFKLPLNMIIRNSRGDTVVIKDIVNDSERIVLRISNTFCPSCIDAELMRISELCNDSSVIILATYQNPRVLKVVESKNAIRNPIFYIEQSLASIFLSENDKYGSPYYFTINRKGQCLSTFFPSLEHNSLSERYISYSQQFIETNIIKESIFFDKSLYVESVKLGDTVNLELDYVNIYDQPLIIKQVDFSCDCVAVEYSKCELDSRLNDKLLVKFIPDRKGERIIQLRVWHNQSPVPEELTLYSNISD